MSKLFYSDRASQANLEKSFQYFPPTSVTFPLKINAHTLLWAQASFNLIIELGSSNPAMSQNIVRDMLKEVEKNPGEAGGWQTIVVGLVIQAAFCLTNDLGLHDPVGARAFCAEVLGLPENMIQSLSFEY